MQTPLHDALEIPPPTTLTLDALALPHWGRNLLFEGVAHIDDTSLRRFSLTFEDCREMRWQLYTHLPMSDDAPTLPPTEIVQISTGRDQHRSPAKLLTGHFGLSLYYGAWSVQWRDP